MVDLFLIVLLAGEKLKAGMFKPGCLDAMAMTFPAFPRKESHLPSPSTSRLEDMKGALPKLTQQNPPDKIYL